MKLSEHFTLAEFTSSQTALRRGLNNQPNQDMIKKLTWLAEKMEQVRALLGMPVQINSAYRSATLNRAIGGSSTSQHCKGEAVDFVCPQFGTPREICKAIMQSGIEFDQLIYEGAWVHISFRESKQRSATMTAHFSGGAVRYTNGISV